MSVVSDILEISKLIKNGRNSTDVSNHFGSEAQELFAEIAKLESGAEQGDDGVFGEAIDCIICLVDLIYQIKPDVTEDEIRKYAATKLAKWQRVYG